MGEFTRPEWDEYFLDLAVAVSKRADCRRRQHGAVIVKNHRVLSTGYNGSPAGDPGCLSGACPRGLLSYEEVATMSDYEKGPGRCISVHAESNAIIYGDGDKMRGGTIYVTGEPCPACRKLIAGAGLTAMYPEILYPEFWAA